MKVNYIACDVCGNKIQSFSRFTFKRLFSKRVQIDICDKCIEKLYIVAKDVYSKEKVLENTNYKRYKDTSLCSAYLEGVDDTLKLLNDYKIRKEIERKNRKI